MSTASAHGARPSPELGKAGVGGGLGGAGGGVGFGGEGGDGAGGQVMVAANTLHVPSVHVALVAFAQICPAASAQHFRSYSHVEFTPTEAQLASCVGTAAGQPNSTKAVSASFGMVGGGGDEGEGGGDKGGGGGGEGRMRR